MPTPVRRRSSSPMLQPAAWMSTRLRTLSWPRTHTRRRPPVSTGARKAAPPTRYAPVVNDGPALREYDGGSHTTPAAQHASPAASRPSSCPASSADPAPAPIRNCESQSPRAPPAIAVVALVGDHLFDPRTVRLHQLHLLGRHRQRLRQRRRIAGRRILHRHRDDGSRVHVHPVLGLVGQVRPTVRPSSSRPSRPGPAGDCHSLFDVFLFFRDRSKRARSARVGVSTPDASANRRRNAS